MLLVAVQECVAVEQPNTANDRVAESLTPISISVSQ